MIPSSLRLLLLTGVFLSTVAFVYYGDVQEETYPQRTRAEMIDVADRLARHSWTCEEANTVAECEQETTYASDFEAGQTYTGIAYDWGGMDDELAFEANLEVGEAAGSHSWHGSTWCTTGIDCSGLVGLAWGITDEKLSTTHFDSLFVTPEIDVFRELQPGDALNKAGRHIVLFAGYAANGEPLVYEANAAQYRVVYQQRSWSSLNGYKVVRYPNLID